MSEDYFTNRQDRYIVFKKNKELCNFFQDLIKTISSFSFTLQSNNDVTFAFSAIHPYKGSKTGFNNFAKKQLCELMERYSNKFSIVDAVKAITQFKIHSSVTADKMHASNVVYDTLVFPLLQMRTMGISTDEKVTSNILSSAPKNANLTLATAYFNLTDNYWSMLLSNHARIVKLVMAHPKAMGFYKAPGLAGNFFFFLLIFVT